MRKTTIIKLPLDSKKTVDTVGLQAMLSCGRKSAVDVGMAAGAKICIGRRVLWNIKKVQQYLDTVSE